MEARKMLATAVLLIVVDRIEFAYYPFEGMERYIPFVWNHEPIKISWWVYLLSIQVQHFLWTVILWLWLPMRSNFKWVVIAFGLCVIEFPLTYGEPIAKLPLPFDWYFPISCSMLRLFSVLYFLTIVVVKALKDETD